MWLFFRLDNCRNAMTLAKEHFDIPLVVRPEDLSSADLDELSGMTYLSYFMKVDSPGYHATLDLVRRLLRGGTVNNFTVSLFHWSVFFLLLPESRTVLSKTPFCWYFGIKKMNSYNLTFVIFFSDDRKSI